MARTSRDEGVNADSGGQNVSKAPGIGSAQQSSNAWLGISDRVESGTTGSRPEPSHGSYGGDQNGGDLFKGTSSDVDASTMKQINAGQGEKSSASTGQYGSGSPNYLDGGVGSREQMTIGGGENKGQYVGDGVGATPDTDVTQYFISGNVPLQMDRNQFLAGTDEARDRNMARAKKGIGTGSTTQ